MGRNGPVAIAVSGGSDSRALLMIADSWARRTGRALIVLTVDHGLRPESSGEARHVANVAEAMGHPAKILTWQPEKRSQDAARRARHALLASGCHDAGAELLLLGHTWSDVQETMLMRLSRPSSLMGAVGPQVVSVSPIWPEGRGLRIGRPVLGQSREALRMCLKAREIPWIEDPSNDADAYERVRVRKLVACLSPGRLDGITRDAMRLRALEDAQLASVLDKHVSVDLAGLITLQLDRWDGGPRVSARLLSLLLQAAAGSARGVAGEQVEALAASIAAGGPEARLTLGGAWLQRRGNDLLIGRDPGECRSGWRENVWDGRYEQGASVTAPDAVPFLVRHAVPDGAGWHEIISDRLASWVDALRASAGLGASMEADLGEAEAPAVTTHPG